MDSSLFGFIWKNSKRDQLFLLALTVVTFPILYATLELPKRIINDAIGSAESTITLFGFDLTQIQFLLTLSFGYLFAVLIHGLLKMRLNTMKGVTAERLLRLFRFQLIARLLRFPPSYFKETSQGELVSMVTSEAEPMGGLMGDMVAQPVFQAGQMLIIVFFLFMQSVWFGLAGIALIPLQAWLIPMLQRQINLLNKERIKEVRAFSAEIGESAAGVSDLRINGGVRPRLGLFTTRLSRIFSLRFRIYQKKFFMKFLNNFITQLTPFFFYTVGGILAIQGQITVGGLVAALAAYKDLSSPWKELLTYYNQTQDMALRWQIVIEKFNPADATEAALFEGVPDSIPHLRGPIEIQNLSVKNSNGNPILRGINLTIPQGSQVAIRSSNPAERDAIADVLTREIKPQSGHVVIGGQNLAELHQAVISARIGYTHSNPYLFAGSVGENLLMPLTTADAILTETTGKTREQLHTKTDEIIDHIPQIDPEIAGFETEAEVREWWFELVQALNADELLIRRMLYNRIDAERHPELAEAIVKMRPAIHARLKEMELRDVVYRLDPERFNPTLPLGGNLLFAAPRYGISQTGLASNKAFIGLIAELGMAERAIAISQTIMETLSQTFGREGSNHPLFTALDLDPELYERLVGITMRRAEHGDAALSEDEFALLLTVPFAFTAEQIGAAFPDNFRAEIVEIRKKHGPTVRERAKDMFLPFSPDIYIPRFSLLENAIYGRISRLAGAKEERVVELVSDMIREEGLRLNVAEMLFDVQTQIGASNIPAVVRERIAFSRSGIKKPDVLILNNAVASSDAQMRSEARKKLRELLPDTTLIFIEENFNNPDNYDLFAEIENGQLQGVHANEMSEDETDDLGMKLQEIAKTDLFKGLDTRNQRLLAFAAQWYEAEPGQVVFEIGEPADAAYLCVSGSATLSAVNDNGEEWVVTTIEPGRLIGDLSIILDEPRQLALTATQPTKFLRISANEFRAVIESDPQVLHQLLKTVGGYLVVAANRLREANVVISSDASETQE